MMPWWGWVLVAFAPSLTALFGWAWGFSAGKRTGLRAPLPERVRVLRAEQRRADLALGHQPPRVRRLTVRGRTTDQGIE